jgi:hypothetical protein
MDINMNTTYFTLNLLYCTAYFHPCCALVWLAGVELYPLHRGPLVHPQHHTLHPHLTHLEG